MKSYKVTITETLEMTVDIEAHSHREAERIAKENWKNSNYILDSEYFTGVAFQVKEDKEIER